MFARISLALVLTAFLVVAQIRAGSANPETCQQDFNPLQAELQTRGKAFSDAAKRKANAKELCARVTAYANAESKVLNFFEKRGAECGVPPNAADGLKKSRVRTVEIRTKICQAAANPTPQQAPSAGLSGALGPSSGAVTQETPSAGGIFDTLSGNILQQ